MGGEEEGGSYHYIITSVTSFFEVASGQFLKYFVGTKLQYFMETWTISVHVHD